LAFQLGDHERVTTQAYREFVKCFPNFENQVSLKDLIQADLDEDLNLVDKELFYSHFYNPHKKLNLWWREDSEGRINGLAPALQQCRAAGALTTAGEVSALGYTIHHFQDMAVPAHVVPVNHSLWDGFESFVASDDINSGWSCAQIVGAGDADLTTILKQTAEQTLKAVAEFGVVATNVEDRSQIQISGSDFWKESEDSSFGQYGDYGNVFGQTEIDSNDTTWNLDKDAFRLFKRQQLQLAVQSTLRAFAWTLKPN
jgi:hypothetical protein